MKMLRWLLAACIVAQCACADPPDPVVGVEPMEELGAQSVLVLNEGLFRRGNASVSLLDVEAGEARLDVLQLLDDRQLDVLQSAIQLNDSLLLFVVNNTNELLIVGRDDLHERRSFAALGSPRFAASTSDSTCLVTDLYAGQLLELNFYTGASRTISLAAHTEELVVVDDRAYVLAPSSQLFYTIDTRSLNFENVDTLSAKYSSIASYSAETFLLAAGVQAIGDTAKATLYSSALHRELHTIIYSQAEASLYPRVVVKGDTSYVLQRTLTRLVRADSSSNANLVMVQLPIDQVEQPYGLGVDPVSGAVFVADAGRLFSGNGVVHRVTGQQLEVEVGALPNGFLFLD